MQNRVAESSLKMVSSCFYLDEQHLPSSVLQLTEEAERKWTDRLLHVVHVYRQGAGVVWHADAIKLS